jgi:hypothetical protein
MLRGRELAEVTKAVHWATLRQPAPVLTTAFAQEQSSASVEPDASHQREAIVGGSNTPAPCSQRKTRRAPACDYIH